MILLIITGYAIRRKCSFQGIIIMPHHLVSSIIQNGQDMIINSMYLIAKKTATCQQTLNFSNLSNNYVLVKYNTFVGCFHLDSSMNSCYLSSQSSTSLPQPSDLYLLHWLTVGAGGSTVYLPFRSQPQSVHFCGYKSK